jgi:hypothetical protein
MIRVPATVSTSVLDDELVILDERTGKYFGLNKVGSSIFAAIKETGSEEEAVARLVREFDAPAERIEADVRAFVLTLVERGLAERGE